MHPLAERVATTNMLLAREIDDALCPSYPPAKARDKTTLEITTKFPNPTTK